MPRPGPRLHRLPQRLDYTLIPAPLDLSLTEKSPLPTIIVTPSSPSSPQDYSIAFFVPPPKPTLRERVNLSLQSAFHPRTRTMLIFIFIFFILLCHYLVDSIAAGRSHLDLSPLDRGGIGASLHRADGWFSSWFNWGALWNGSSKPETIGDFARILESGS
ncbi:hypothetical protein AX15_005803 [Amanita polypyramis BW_CC]|nr:hypothetical protein AX15_005803 [Amanita polypyramis BW_CC]